MAPDLSNTLSELNCTKLVELLQGDLSWKWDSRFETALAEFSVEKKDTVGKILENHLGMAWDSVTIEIAPESVQRVLVRLGGVMSGQLLYAAGLPQEGIIFCAWWPWGNGQTISIRLGTVPKESALLAALASPGPK